MKIRPLNAKPHEVRAWDANPFVWVVGFKRVEDAR